jgi:beta-lactamase superfamily II metal-dependent hydrolase
MAKTAKKRAVKTTKKSSSAKKNGKVDSVSIRMYRAGTGDCFLLQFRSKGVITCKMMIDCGCIQGGRGDFEPWLEDIKKETGNKIDILVVTHEHADHINGFKTVSDLFDKIKFKNVWFSWTEDESDDFANDLRKNHSAIKLAIQAASNQLQGLLDDNYYKNLWKDEYESNLMLDSKSHFIASLGQLDKLNMNNVVGANGKIPSMTKLFSDFKVIKPDTKVAYFSPGDLIKNIEGLTGVRIFVLGPPRDTDLLNTTKAEGENYEKREKKSSRDFAFAAAVLDEAHGAEVLPFETEFELTNDKSVKIHYEKDEAWRQIEHDWLYTAGSIALRYEGSINNTSLALAIQFEDSQRVLLFPGDAEFGNWKSWHALEWNVDIDGQNKKVGAEYLMNNTVFYKIGHHCSQNGSASRLGVEMMTHEDLSAMAPLNFAKINTGWLNTMPNDILCATLIKKTKGRLFFSGDYRQILPNIKTSRVSVTKANEERLKKNNEEFDGLPYISCEVSGE